MELVILLFQRRDIPFFTIETTIGLLLFAGFSVLVFYSYKMKLINYAILQEHGELEHEKELLKAQLDTQEKTFQNISREIHDNIGLSLTLAKLRLNTIDFNRQDSIVEQINLSVSTLTQAIYDLSDLSRSFNSYFIHEQGLIKSLNEELFKFEKLNIFKVNFSTIGEPVFMEGHKEVVLFRIIQEAFNNILKHANATIVDITLNYQKEFLNIHINDNGKGMPTEYINSPQCSKTSGLTNIKARTTLLSGTCSITSNPNLGTCIQLIIPL